MTTKRKNARKENIMSTKQNAPSTQSASKMKPEEYDVVILGGGTGGTVAAWTFASEGRRVAVIEHKYMGGSCPNIACLPSKNIIHSAKVAWYVRKSEEFGIPKRDFTVDMRAVRERKRRMVSGWNNVYLENFKKTGAEFILGSGRFIGPKTVEVTLSDGTKRQLRGTNVIVNTGTHASFEPIPGLADAQPLTHIEALELDQVPEHLLVVGGGYIGSEMAQAFRRFGSKVTLIDRNERLMHREDDDVTETLQSLFEEEGIELALKGRIKQVSGKSGESVRILVEKSGNGATKTLDGSHLLVASGRMPNTQGIGLELAGVELTNRGYIKVNEHLETSAVGVWAIGEVAGSPQFTHVSVDDFRVVHASITGGKRVATGRQVPFCLFTDPEFARIGLSEKEAKAQGIAYRLFKIPMEAVMRATTLSETSGFLKALIEVDSDRILGFTAFGVGAAEIMTSVQIARNAGLPYTTLRDTILTHPTLVEGLIPLFSSAATLSELTGGDKRAGLKQKTVSR
jgi:pyruvate/2-oxoglutarate dehydrogenase complex dihydrolipoamide dehydrogenase (E3) component